VALVLAIEHGMAHHSGDGERWVRLRKDGVLKEGQWLKTDAKSMASLCLGTTGPSVRLMPNTTLRIDILPGRGGSGAGVPLAELALFRGWMLFDIERSAPGATYHIKAPKLTCVAEGPMQCAVSAGGLAQVLGGSVRALCSPAGGPFLYPIISRGEEFDAQKHSGAVEPMSAAAVRELRRDFEGLRRLRRK
jgi:hypothetical protein